MDKKRKNIKRGLVSELIMKALKSGDKYGYQIIKEVFDSTNGEVDIKQPTLYNSLKVLESNGLVKSYDGKETLGGKRRYFKLTNKGLKSLESIDNESTTKIDESISNEEKTSSFADNADQGKLFEEESIPEANENEPQIDPSNLLVEEEVEPKFKKYDNPLDRLDIEEVPDEERDQAMNILYDQNRTVIPKEEKEKIQVRKEQVAAFKPYPNNNSFEIMREIERAENPEPVKPKEDIPQQERLNKQNAENYRAIINKLVDTSVLHEEVIKPEERLENSEPMMIAQSISLNDLRAKYQIEGYQLKYHEKKIGGNSSLIYKNRATLLTAFFLFLIGTLEIICLYLSVQERMLFSNFSYALMEAVPVGILLISLFSFLLNPKKKTRPNFNFKQAMLTSLLIMVNVLVVWIAVCLIFFNFNLQEYNKVVIQLIIPTMYIILIPLWPLLYSLVVKMKRMYT